MIQEDIPVLADMIGQLYNYLPVVPGATLPVVVSQRGLNFKYAGDDLVTDWLEILRTRFNMPDLELWVLAPWEKKPKIKDSSLYTHAFFVPEGKDERVETLAESRKVALCNEAGESLLKANISSKIQLYYTGYKKPELQTTGKKIDGREVYFSFPTNNWIKWVSQYWEFEIVQLDGVYYMSDFTAGHPWAIYPLLHLLCMEWELPSYQILIKMDFLEANPSFDELPGGFAGFHILDEAGKASYSPEVFDTMDAYQASGNPIRLELFTAEDEVNSFSQVRVNPKTEIFILWEEFEVEDDDEDW
ncbi:MAG: hypothetical protein KDC34_00425 [Saprospiraceae bacterium]|nr:hypothetical protein [Saprospiraceae bacterium]